MASKTFTAPRLPAAPVEYSQQFMDQLTNILRLYFTQLDNPSPMLAASQNVGSTTSPVISALTFAEPNPLVRGSFKISLPTDADLPNLRSGDVYYDTSGGVATSYPLRIKA
jgi:hypothetical protein